MMLDDALAYARRGWAVIPLKPRGKIPLTQHGVIDATTDENTIRSWWGKRPDANIGIACDPSGLAVIDIDAKSGGLDTLDQLTSLDPLCVDTLISRTGGGGLHLVFEGSIPNTTSKIGKGIDSKGRGGYIVAPPSVHESGNVYRWEDDTAKPEPLPDFWRVRLNGHGETKPESMQQSSSGGKIAAGARNSTLTSHAGTMRRRGMPVEAIEAALQAENQTRCDPPLPQIEVMFIAQSVSRYDPKSKNTVTVMPSSKPTSGEYLMALESFGYSLRFNEMTQVIEINDRPLTDAIAAKIRTDMRDAGYQGMRAIEDAYTARAMQNSFHPIKDYFNGLQWDGGNHVARLAGYFTDSGPIFADGRSWFYHAFRRWLIGYVARVFEHIQLPMLVLESAQRKGKSFFVRWLASVLTEYFIESPINPDDKDSFLRLASSFIWEVSELGATVRKSDIEALKSFVTLHHVTVRRPYAKFDLHLPAVAGLIGTINDAGGFLNDSTGTRRALVIPITAIDWRYTETVDVNQVWAEAVAAYRIGESATMTADECDMQAQINSRFEIGDPVADLLNDRFEIDVAHDEWFMPSSELLDTIDAALKGTSMQHSKSIAAALKRHGIESTRRRDAAGIIRRGYPGITRRL